MRKRIIFDISEEMLENWFVTAMEGGSNYWIDKISEYCPDKIAIEGYSVAIEVEGMGRYELTKEKLLEGLKTCPSGVAQRLMDESYDADDADILLQQALFSEVVFG